MIRCVFFPLICCGGAGEAVGVFAWHLAFVLYEATSLVLTIVLCRSCNNVCVLPVGLSQRIEDVSVDWAEYTGIFDGFEV